MLAGPASHPWRRFLRFSVRGLIVLVLAIGAGLGWIVRSAHVQRDAVAAIQKAGGLVLYDSEWSGGYYLLGGESWPPGWLADLVGVDYFVHVKSVWMYSSLTPTDATTADATIAAIGRLARLKHLRLDHSSLSDSGLAHLKGLTNLSGLDLSETQVSDAGLAHLEGLTNLSLLAVSGTHITSAGLVHLNGLTNLKFLLLPNTRVTDAGLAHLKGLTNLSSVDLLGTDVTGAGVEELKQALPSLTVLR
jgi:hypothetical protein